MDVSQGRVEYGQGNEHGKANAPELQPWVVVEQDPRADPAEDPGERDRHTALVRLKRLADPMPDQRAEQIQQQPRTQLVPPLTE